jgi:hypothetical protein
MMSVRELAALDAKSSEILSRVIALLNSLVEPPLRNQVPYGKLVRRGIVGVEAEDALEFAICRHLLPRSQEHSFVCDRLLDY